MSTRKTKDRVLRIDIGPDTVDGGVAWYVKEQGEEGGGDLCSGGSARRQQDLSEEGWLRRARGLVSPDIKGVQWERARVVPFGYNDGWFRCYHGVTITVVQRVKA